MYEDNQKIETAEKERRLLEAENEKKNGVVEINEKENDKGDEQPKAAENSNKEEIEKKEEEEAGQQGQGDEKLSDKRSINFISYNKNTFVFELD